MYIYYLDEIFLIKYYLKKQNYIILLHIFYLILHLYINHTCFFHSTDINQEKKTIRNNIISKGKIKKNSNIHFYL